MNTIQVEKRDPSAKAKQLRRLGIIPCVIYGGRLEDSIAGQIDQKSASKFLRTQKEGSMVTVEYDGKAISTLLKSLEHNALGDKVLHISFQALDAEKTVNESAHIILTNKDKAGGIVEQELFEVKYSALPADLFNQLTIDLADYKVGDELTVGEIPAFCNDKIDLQTAKDQVVFKIREKHEIVEEEETTEEESV